VSRLRIAIIADYLEEGWPSMDLVADMLGDCLRREHAASVDASLVRPALRRRASRLPGLGRFRPATTFDRLANRLWDYPRHVAGLVERYDVFHLVDHSYAQLVHRLPASRTLVTCHDTDTFRSVLEPERERRSAAFRAMTRHILDGLRKAGHIACDTAATRDALVSLAGVPPGRTSVVHNGPHPSCTPAHEPTADAEAGRLLAPSEGIPLLHVGSSIARKRIDVLLRVFAAVREARAEVRLVRVGGPLTASQRALARDLGVADAVLALPFLDRATLAAVYRRSALVLLPSDREGFGLPVLEALACGTPVVASDIEALREVGGDAVTYCPVGDVACWRASILELLQARRRPAEWAARRDAGIARAAAFSWSRYTSEIAALYRRLAPAASVAPA
jgi:glycosyltransferase involved in cell wall biosynthesis